MGILSRFAALSVSLTRKASLLQYRPEMAFHHNDGSAMHPGSDASLRMPPNTFEPIFNGLQAERQAVPEVARSNASGS